MLGTQTHTHIFVCHECIKRKTKIYHTLGIVPKSNRQIVERSKMDTPEDIKHLNRSLYCLNTSNLIQSGGVKLFLCRY
jgi:hypothetical protein